MKKYTLVLFILIFSFGLFIFNVNSTRQKVFAQASGCYYTPPSGLPACTGGCYVPQGGPGGGPPEAYWKCVPNGPFTQLLKLGSTGSEVVALQKFLNNAGYSSGTADGKFGPATKAAVIKFQIANGLTGDGIVGALTRAILNKGNVSATPACTLNISYNPTTVAYNGSLTVAYSGTAIPSSVEYNLDNKGFASVGTPFPNSKKQENLTDVGTHNIILRGKNSAGTTCTATASYVILPQAGDGGTGSGTVQISATKDLTDIMFPKGSGCVLSTNTNCLIQRVNYQPLQIWDDPSNPSLSSGVYFNAGGSATINDFEGPVNFSIADPMNPVLNAQNSYPQAQADRTWIHSYNQIRQLAYSKDGQYAVVNAEQARLIFKNGERFSGIVSDQVYTYHVVQYDGNTIYISDSGMTVNLTNLTDDGDLTYTFAKNPKSISMPNGFPTLYTGAKLVLSDQKYLASFESTTPLSDYFPKRLAIYDLTKPNPIATIDLPVSITNPDNRIDNILGTRVTRQRVGNVDYIYVAYTPLVSNSAKLSVDKVAVYKFDFSTKQLTSVAIDVPVTVAGGEHFVGFAGVSINNNPGIIVFSATSTMITTARVYMNSDLQSGKAIDALGGAGKLPSDYIYDGYRSEGIASYTKDNSTYVYFSGSQLKVPKTYVWKIDGTGTPPSTPTPPAPPGGGGSGTAHVSATKDITNILYPSSIPCGVVINSGDPCYKGARPRPIPLKIMDTFSPAALIHADYITPDGFFGPDYGDAYYFGLADPMNPTVVKKITITPRDGTHLFGHIKTATLGRGDGGSNLSDNGLAFSKDGTIAFVASTHNDAGPWIEQGGETGMGGGGWMQAGIVNYAGKVFMIPWYSGDSTVDITNWKAGATLSAPPYGYFIDTYPALPASFPKALSAGFMTSPGGQSVILTQDNYVATLANSLVDNYHVDLSVYDLGKPNAVATVNIPVIPMGAQFIRQQDVGADYLFVIQPNNGYINAQAIVYVYKFTFGTNTLVKIVDGIKLDIGSITGVAGVKINGSIGLLTLDTTVVDTTHNKSEARVYMVSDLATGKVSNVLDNSPSMTTDSSLGQSFKYAGSLAVGNSTYVYVTNSRGLSVQSILAWKIDGTGTVIPPVPPVYPPYVPPAPGNPPVPRPRCATGDKYDWFDGASCSGGGGSVFNNLSCGSSDVFSWIICSPTSPNSSALPASEISQTSSTATANSVTVTWTTDHPTTSRVIYDAVSHSDASVTTAGPANYGYAYSTTENSTLVTSHSVTVTGLTPNTNYFFRPVSHGSPEIVGDETSQKTAATAPLAQWTENEMKNTCLPVPIDKINTVRRAANQKIYDDDPQLWSGVGGMVDVSQYRNDVPENWIPPTNTPTIYPKNNKPGVATPEELSGAPGTGIGWWGGDNPPESSFRGWWVDGFHNGDGTISDDGPALAGGSQSTVYWKNPSWIKQHLILDPYHPTIISGDAALMTKYRAWMGLPEKGTPINWNKYPICSKYSVALFHFTQLLQVGSTGNEVTELQKFLTAAGYYNGAISGLIGRNFEGGTQVAVINFQLGNGLVADGIVGPATRAVLNKSTQSMSITTSSTASAYASSGIARGTLNASSLPGVGLIGILSDGSGDTISVTGGPANDTPELFINKTESGNGGPDTFPKLRTGPWSGYGPSRPDSLFSEWQSFGKWPEYKTNSSGSFSYHEVLNCSAYQTFTPGQTLNLLTRNSGIGTVFYRGVKLRWSDGSETNTIREETSCYPQWTADEMKNTCLPYPIDAVNSVRKLVGEKIHDDEFSYRLEWLSSLSRTDLPANWVPPTTLPTVFPKSAQLGVAKSGEVIYVLTALPRSSSRGWWLGGFYNGDGTVSDDGPAPTYPDSSTIFNAGANYWKSSSYYLNRLMKYLPVDLYASGGSVADNVIMKKYLAWLGLPETGTPINWTKYPICSRPSSTSTPSSSTTYFQFTQLLKNGSSGNEVTELQKFLNNAGYSSGTADGKFGGATKAAVIKFQIANKLNGDGIVGAATRAALNK